MRTVPARDRSHSTFPRGWFALGLLVAVLAVYHAVWRAPFVFDDHAAIVANPSIRSVWPLSGPLSPPAGGLPVSGRPVPNLTLALNYAGGGTAPAGYHAVNVALHGLAALVLFSLVQRTLRRPAIPERVRGGAAEISATVAVLWALHPLATAAVAYTSQRTEVLVSLFLLLTLDAFARAAERAPARVGWAIVSVAACLLGMASKEVMAAAPLLVLLYDRTFVAGSFAAAWRARWRLHVALMATWGLLAWLVVESAGRGGTAGFATGAAPLSYALTQTEAIVRYLGLVAWPSPLVFDYGVPLTTDWRVFLPAGLLVVLLVGLVGVGLWRRPALAFPGAVFFAVLAPSSSVVPITTQTMAEHRMYLPLAAILMLVAVAWHAWLGRRALILSAAVAVALGAATFARTLDYASAEALWRDTLAKRPDNARAHNNLATVLFERGDLAGGLTAAGQAVRLRPDYADAHRNLARALLLSGRVSEALAHAEHAQRIDPASVAGQALLDEARLAVAEASLQADRPREAIAAFEAVIRSQPRLARAHAGLGLALLLEGRSTEALASLDAALALEPPTPQRLTSRALALLDLGRVVEARAALVEALRLDPNHAPAREVLDGLP
jgi:Flp pilus assembly protein TadD